MGIGTSLANRAAILRHPERDTTDEAASILAEGLVADVAFVGDVGPVVLPMTYHYDPLAPTLLHLHGAHHSRLMTHVASGASICVGVTLVDGLVYSKTALYHSVNYRSVVVFGRVAEEQPTLAEQRFLLEAMIARYFQGREAGVDYAVPPEEHLRATAFVTLRIDEWSAKSRSGGPKGPSDEDPSMPGTAGVVAIARWR